jgi:DNA-binding IclR family transcriptional regulator
MSIHVLTPGQEGSEEACGILMLLSSRPAGMRAIELGSLLQLDERTLERALRGLKERHRIVCTGRGTSSLWQLTRYALLSE